MSHRGTIIIGGGVTGLACGLVSGLPVYEMAETPGGTCASYYMVPGSAERLNRAPRHGDAYRFEIGGGHWLWGGDPLVLEFVRPFTSLKAYARKAAVFFANEGLCVPYPIQNHLGYLGSSVARQAIEEMENAGRYTDSVTTMADWLLACFGPTLYDIFFGPFHDLYTAGLWQGLAPQDESKSPVNTWMTAEGAFDHAPPQSGSCKASFLYPTDGLDVLAERMAQRCNIHYRRKVTNIPVNERAVVFDDGSTVPYEKLLCTLSLDKTLRMADLNVSAETDPFTSAIVINIGAVKGPRCPREHWLYIPHSKAGFHKVGFYSNVDSSFLPASVRDGGSRTSIYVENAYLGGQRLGEEETKALTESVVQELRAWGWIEDVEVADPTWVETAYTWVWANSQWRQEAKRVLQEYGIYQVGGYARWAPNVTGQGIAQSIRDGLCVGASFKDLKFLDQLSAVEESLAQAQG